MSRLPAKSKIPCAGELLEYVFAGTGTSTVVLINGSGGPIEGWHRVFEAIADFARVFAYNRPGIGGSPKPLEPQTGHHLVESLRLVLRAAGFPPPYVLVGHSFGGLIVNLFSRLYPDEVAGAVFLEATSPQDVFVLKKHENAAQRLLRSLLGKVVPPDPYSETEQAHVTVSELLRAPPFPCIPLAVVTGGRSALAWATPAESLAARAQHQRELAALSPLGRQIVAARSGHFPQLSEPELVVDAIKRTVNRTSERGARQACASP